MIMPKPAIPQDQLESPLFATLPLDIRRLIYRQLWLDRGLTQHIFAMTNTSYLLSFPCILSPEELNQEPGHPPPAGAGDTGDAPDVPDDADNNGEPERPQSHDDPGDIDGALQDIYSDDPSVADASEPPNNTPWCAHFACFRNNSKKWDHSFTRMYTACYREGLRASPDLRGSTILTTFLVCKRMYQEASESLFSGIRFSFTTTVAMDVFLSEVPRALFSRVQFVDIMSGNMGERPLQSAPFDSRPPAQEVHDKLKAAFPKLRELRLTLHPRRGGETIPQQQDLEPLYALKRELDSLRRFEVFLPTKCEEGSEVGYGEAHASLQDAPFTVKVVPPGWHEFAEQGPHFYSPRRGLHA